MTVKMLARGMYSSVVGRVTRYGQIICFEITRPPIERRAGAVYVLQLHNIHKREETVLSASRMPLKLTCEVELERG